jgi:hypothetical protein
VGFLRKSLIIGTGGAAGMFVKPNSKKERIANAAEKQLRLQTEMLKASQQPRPKAARASRKRTPPTPAAPKYDITCPKCSTVQSSPAGQHFCPMCGFPIEVSSQGQIGEDIFANRFAKPS